jgi:hypothetical protein
MKTRLDSRSAFPEAMENYLEFNGWHFSKKMCQWAVSKMYREVNGKKEAIEPYTMESLKVLKDKSGMDFELSYDAVYIANMCKADFLSSSIPNETLLARYVKDVIEDPDGYDGMPFTRFYADCIGSGTSIPWDDLL